MQHEKKTRTFTKIGRGKRLDQIMLLTKFKDELSAYSNFSEINYETKFVSLFERIFGENDQFTHKAKHIASGIGVKGVADVAYGSISDEQFNRNKHNAFLSLLDEAISFKKMEPLLTEETHNKGSEVVMDNKVFIVHGHNDALKYQLADWLRKIEIEPVILHEQANMGITSILGKIKRYSGVDCAIVLFTSDDIGGIKGDVANLKPRARQNVVFEAGLFLGLLGSEKVIMLCEKDLERPGDLDGCIYIEADEHGGWKEKLRAEFDAIGIEYKH